MAVNINLARQKVEAVRTETEDFANTALRVGGAMSDILEYSYEETERAKGAEKNIASLVQENAGKINILNAVSATKAELSEEVERAKSAEEAIRDSVESLSDDMNAASEDISNLENAISNEVKRATSEEEALTQQVKSNFAAFSELGVEESAKSDGYEIALTKKTNTAEKTKVKVPVYDMQNPSATPVGLVDELFVEDIVAKVEKKIPKVQDSTEEEIKEMIANGTWEEGVLYLAYEEEEEEEEV